MNDESEFVIAIIFSRLLIKEKQVAAVNELYYIWGLWTFSLSKLYFWRPIDLYVNYGKKLEQNKKIRYIILTW